MAINSARACAFCSRVFDSKNKRAKEHVLRLKMLKNLGYEKQKINPTLTGPGGVVISRRHHTADNLLAGDVCEKCNSGWINDLDNKVEDILLDLSQSRLFLFDLSQEQKMSLSWWCLKTACTFILTDKPERRHLEKSIYTSVMNQADFPKGVVIAGSNLQAKGAYVVNLDIWEVVYNTDYNPKGNYQGFKVGIQYDNLFLLAACFHDPRFEMRLNPILHQEILHSSCTYQVGFDAHNSSFPLPPHLANILINQFSLRVSAVERS